MTFRVARLVCLAAFVGAVFLTTGAVCSQPGLADHEWPPTTTTRTTTTGGPP